MQFHKLMNPRALTASFGLLALLLSNGASAACEEGDRYMQLARKSGAEQDYGQASLWLERSIKACASYDAWHLLGTAHKQQRRIEEALAAYTKAVELAPDANSAAVSSARYGQVLALNGQRFEALTMLERAMENHSSPPVWIRTAAKEIDLNIVDQPISRESIKRSLSSQEFGLMSFAGKDGESAAPRPKVGIPINFEFDSIELDVLTRSNLIQLGSVLSDDQYQNNSFTLIGHSDVRGSETYNYRLSESRAQSIEAALIGAYPSLEGRLKVDGAGESRPKYRGDDASEIEHRLNRRLEVIVN